MPKYTQPRKTWFYPVSFKIKAVNLSLKYDVMSKDVALALDIHLLMLSRWRKEYRGGKFSKHQRDQDSNEIISKVPTKKELSAIQKLKKENDLLKKWQRYLADVHQNDLDSSKSSDKP